MRIDRYDRWNLSRVFQRAFGCLHHFFFLCNCHFVNVISSRQISSCPQMHGYFLKHGFFYVFWCNMSEIELKLIKIINRI